MARNGSGTYSRAVSPYVYNTVIDQAAVNAEMDDIATALTNSLAKNGETTPTANLPLGGYKLTGVGAATARTDAATLANIQDGTGVYVATVGGTADVITLTPSPAITAYAAGQTFRFIASGANTTNVTVNVSGLGAKAITKNGATALIAGDIPSGMMVEATYDGTQFVLGTNGAATAGAATPTVPFVDTTAIVVGSSDATKKVRLEVDGLTTATTRVITVPDVDGTLLYRNVADQAITGGGIITSNDLGTISSGTVTPDPGDRPMQHYTNGGAHTLGVSANGGSILLDITNNGSAGAITTSGFTKVSGDAFTTTNGHKFRCAISIGNGGSLLQVQALQ